MDYSNIVINTSRLRLVSINQNFANDIFQNFTEEITTYMMPKAPKKIEETQQFIESATQKSQKGEELQIVVLDRTSGEFLGCAGIHSITTKTPTLGIWLKKSAHGKGIGKEAITALKQWAEKNLEYEYLVYPVDRRNVPSRKIPESLGGIIGAEYKKTSMSGNVLDEIEYRIYK